VASKISLVNPQEITKARNTHQAQYGRVLHEGRSAAYKGHDHNYRSSHQKNVYADVVLVDLQNLDPFVEAGFDTDPEGETEDGSAENLKIVTFLIKLYLNMLKDEMSNFVHVAFYGRPRTVSGFRSGEKKSSELYHFRVGP
jgi:hypothetical protein